VRILVTGGSGFIGTNLVEDLRRSGTKVLNLDLRPPLCSAHLPFWQKGDILDRASLVGIFSRFEPTAVVHLAARTDCVENTTVEEGYRSNTEGTANVIEAIKSTPSVSRLVITSTQYVCRPGHVPQHDEDYAPHTVYGQSKVHAERLTRSADLPCTWTIIRPTNIWGPWHMRYRDQFLRVLRKGFYLHPGRQKVLKSYGYVGNVVRQIRRILELPHELVNGKTLYVGDRPIDQLAWVNAFSSALRDREVRVVPRCVIRGLALAGDVISVITRSDFFITTSRFRSMTQDYVAPIEPTFDLLGDPPFSMEQGVQETVAWLKANTAERAA